MLRQSNKLLLLSLSNSNALEYLLERKMVKKMKKIPLKKKKKLKKKTQIMMIDVY